MSFPRLDISGKFGAGQYFGASYATDYSPSMQAIIQKFKTMFSTATLPRSRRKQN